MKGKYKMDRLMASENFIININPIHMKANGKMTNQMDLENKYGLEFQSIREVSKKDAKMVKVTIINMENSSITENF